MASVISLSHFVVQPAQQNRLNMLPDIPLHEPRCLVYGPQRSGKTTLLFHYAFQLAAKGREVVFLCDKAQLDQNPPLLPFSTSEQHPAFRNIRFKYIHDLHQLRNYGACLHLLQEPPAAIIVDDLSKLLANSKLQDKRARDTEVTRSLAYLVDGLEQLRFWLAVALTVAYAVLLGIDCASQRLVKRLDVMLLVSDTCADDGPHNLYLLQRWFPLTFAVTGNRESAGGLLTLGVAPNCKDKVSAAAGRAAVDYTVTQTYLHVESVAL